MFDFHEKRKIRALVYSKVFIGFLIVIGIFIARSAYERYSVERDMAEKRDAKLAELEQLNHRFENLEGEIVRLKNDRGIEEELRNRFDAVREGEQVVVILDDASLGATSLEGLHSSEEQKEGPQEPWWSFLRIFSF